MVCSTVRCPANLHSEIKCHTMHSWYQVYHVTVLFRICCGCGVHPGTASRITPKKLHPQALRRVRVVPLTHEVQDMLAQPRIALRCHVRRRQTRVGLSTVMIGVVSRCVTPTLTQRKRMQTRKTTFLGRFVRSVRMWWLLSYDFAVPRLEPCCVPDPQPQTGDDTAP